MTVTYDPRSYRNTAMMASQEAARLSDRLRSMGVDQINANILPVNEQGDEARLLVSYNAYTAHAPKGCTSMPGMSDRVIEDNENYKLGCGIETMIAKQVARPKDLLGQENTDTYTEGRSTSNIIEDYRYGAKNEPLDGESASGTD
jgi:pilus biogenesis lipoprotein CpaD